MGLYRGYSNDNKKINGKVNGNCYITKGACLRGI